MKRLVLFVTAVLIMASTGGTYASERFTPLDVRAGLYEAQKGSSHQKPGIELFAIKRIFDCFRIPYDTVEDIEDIFLYRVVYLAGPLHNSVLDSRISGLLYDYVEEGGTLVAAGEIGSLLYPLFGIKGVTPSRNRYRLVFIEEDPALAYLNRPQERNISLGNGEKHFYEEVIWSFGYTPEAGASVEAGTRVLARFDDGSPGMLTGSYGRGRFYLIGLTAAEGVLLPQIGKDYEAQRKYINSFEPSADAVMLIFRSIYENALAPLVQVSTLPYARPFALVLSHDVDAQTSFVDSLKFAALEEKFGVTGTYFENTKYFTDWMDIDYYNIPENVEAVRELKARGHDVGSHTVSHYKKLSDAPEGSRGVTFSSYRPEEKVTVQGEVRVSKELLDRDIPGQNTVSFRAGDLEFPQMLVRVLEEAGYRYNSTFSANDVLTAYPFRALRERNLGSTASDLFEIPITLDDSMGYLTPSSVDDVVSAWRGIVKAYGENDAPVVLLIHPSDTRKKSYKLEAQESLMRWVEQNDGWMGNLTEFGDFWRARDGLDFSVSVGDRGTLLIRIDQGADSVHPMIGFVVHTTEDISGVIVEDSEGNRMDFTAKKRGDRLYLTRPFSAR
ncbi:MAG: polysaccharide deacetylase family protein [Spirochaetes bacterium]|nr:polysaccharide deacetylase family protein [Spirochaetota bacterium]